MLFFVKCQSLFFFWGGDRSYKLRMQRGRTRMNWRWPQSRKQSRDLVALFAICVPSFRNSPLAKTGHSDLVGWNDELMGWTSIWGSQKPQQSVCGLKLQKPDLRRRLVPPARVQHMWWQPFAESGWGKRGDVLLKPFHGISIHGLGSTCWPEGDCICMIPSVLPSIKVKKFLWTECWQHASTSHSFQLQRKVGIQYVPAKALYRVVTLLYKVDQSRQHPTPMPFPPSKKKQCSEGMVKVLFYGRWPVNHIRDTGSMNGGCMPIGYWIIPDRSGISIILMTPREFHRELRS